MKKYQIIIIISAVVLLLAAAIFFLLNMKISIFNEEYKLTATEITLDSEEISSFDSLISNLKKFIFLKKADFGDYTLDSNQIDIIKSEFPKVSFSFAIYQKLYENQFSTASEVLDLSECKIDDIEPLMKKLTMFTKIKKVILGNNYLSENDFILLKEKYPNIDFDAVVQYKIADKLINSNAESIDFSKTEIDVSELIARLSLIRNLKSVDLHETNISGDELLKLYEKYPEVAFATTVKILGKTYESDTETLNFDNIKIKDLDSFKKELKLFSKLKQVDMCNCGISNEEMAKMRDEFKSIKFVWRIKLGEKWSLKTNATSFSVLIYKYDYTRMTSKDIEVLKYCTDLKALDLGHQQITDISVIGDYLQDLRILILADNRVSDLTPLSKLKHLHYLEIFVNSIKDLTPISQCKELVDLNISYNYKLYDVIPLLDYPKLERLWFEHTPLSSNKDAIKALKERYPNATIVSSGEGSIDNEWRTHERYFEMIKMFHDTESYYSPAFAKYDGE